tara:strand:- start:11974 stop:12726 length:753 start_codon:yes stop_codon:yes gene_type:complete
MKKMMIDDYVNSLKIQRHQSSGRWYSQGKSLNWKPSVTTIIGETCSKGKFFDEWLMKNGLNAERLRDEAAERGTAVHEAIEALLERKEVHASTEFIRKSLMSFEKWYYDIKPSVICQEIFLYHKDMLWAGTPDIVATIDGSLSIIDIKTGDYRKSHEIQQLMYKDLWNKIFPECPIVNIYGLYTKGKWMKEPSYSFRKFNTNNDIHKDVYKLWCFLNFPYGKPKPKYKAKLKEVFKLGPSGNPRRIDELL